MTKQILESRKHEHGHGHGTRVRHWHKHWTHQFIKSRTKGVLQWSPKVCTINQNFYILMAMCRRPSYIWKSKDILSHIGHESKISKYFKLKQKHYMLYIWLTLVCDLCSQSVGSIQRSTSVSYNWECVLVYLIRIKHYDGRTMLHRF